MFFTFSLVLLMKTALSILLTKTNRTATTFSLYIGKVKIRRNLNRLSFHIHLVY